MVFPHFADPAVRKVNDQNVDFVQAFAAMVARPLCRATACPSLARTSRSVAVNVPSLSSMILPMKATTALKGAAVVTRDRTATGRMPNNVGVHGRLKGGHVTVGERLIEPSHQFLVRMRHSFHPPLRLELPSRPFRPASDAIPAVDAGVWRFCKHTPVTALDLTHRPWWSPGMSADESSNHRRILLTPQGSTLSSLSGRVMPRLPWVCCLYP